jgi:cell division septal protein FtsQ
MLKEQVITPRGGRGAGRGSDVIVVTTEGRAGKIVQRPSARRGGKAAQDKRAGQQRLKAKRGSWGKVVAWAPTAGKVLVAVCAGLILFKGYRAAAASEFFGVRAVDVSGVSQASEDQIKQIVRRETAATGVWKADLTAISAELERQPWVRTAVVTRVLPSGLRVRITERVPRVVVRTNAGHFVWVDDDGVQVGALTPTQTQPAFFMRGFDESNTETARAENRKRVEAFMQLEGEWASAGLAPRVSELNLDDLHDVRVQLAGDDSQIEVRLSSQDWAKRFGQALKSLDAQRATPRGASMTYTYIDMTGRAPVLGFDPHARALSANAAGEVGAASVESGAETPSATGDARSRDASDDAKGGTRTKVEAHAAKAEAKSKSEKASRDESKKSTQAAGQTRGGAERPRRVTKGA